MSNCENCNNNLKNVGETKTTRKIKELLKTASSFSKKDLFKSKENVILSRDGTEVMPKLLLSSEVLSSLHNSDNENIEIDIPGPNGNILKLLLTKTEIYAPGFKVTDGLNEIYYELGVHYFGVVEGFEDSRVIMNIFKNEVTGIITIDENPIELTRDKTVRDISEYTLHRAGVPPSRNCNTDTSIIHKKVENQIQTRAVLDKYIRFQLEAIDSNTTDVTTLFTAVKDIYLNDPDVEVNILLSGITLWNTGSIPFVYDGTTGPTGGASPSNLENYSTYRLGNLISDVDVYQLIPVDNNNLSGIAWLGFLCSFGASTGPFAITVINSGPTPGYTIYSWNASTVAHELGHNIGSRHTFDCAWTGPTGAFEQSIGGCGNTGESCFQCSSLTLGPCIQPGEDGYVYTSVNGSTGLSGQTLMGYCANYTPQVFGAQPGALIRQKISEAICLPTGPTGPTGIKKLCCYLSKAKKYFKKADFEGQSKNIICLVENSESFLKCSIHELEYVYGEELINYDQYTESLKNIHKCLNKIKCIINLCEIKELCDVKKLIECCIDLICDTKKILNC